MINLHCHTSASDGVITPENIIRQAAAEGIVTLAISDHDTIKGLLKASEAATMYGIRMIHAVEFSVASESGSFHLLGYGIQSDNQELAVTLADMKRTREERIRLMIEKLNGMGMRITFDDVQNGTFSDTLGKPHVAEALVNKGYADKVETAIQRYLNKGGPAYIPKRKIEPADAFKVIKGAGGSPVLAHPKSLDLRDPEEYDRTIQEYVDMGLVGIEVFSKLHTDPDVEFFSTLAQKYHLEITGGSDYHGRDGERLGHYGKDRAIPDGCAGILQRLEDNR